MGATLALNHLIDNNHRDILFVRGKDSYSYDIKEKVYKINEITANFYHENLYNSTTAKTAQNYVKKRHLDNATLKAFKIGYSGNFSELYQKLKAKKV